MQNDFYDFILICRFTPGTGTTRHNTNGTVRPTMKMIMMLMIRYLED